MVKQQEKVKYTWSNSRKKPNIHGQTTGNSQIYMVKQQEIVKYTWSNSRK